MNMNDRLSKIATIIIVCSMLFSGCTSESGDGIENDSDDINDIPELEPEPEDILEINGNDFCDPPIKSTVCYPFHLGFS